MKTLLSVLPLAGLLALSACGSEAYQPGQGPDRPFNEFSRVDVRELSVRIPQLESLDPELRGEILAAARSFPEKMKARLKKKHLFPDDAGKTLVISGDLVEYDPGSRTLRWLFGFGSGTGHVTSEIRFGDEAGTRVANGVAVGTVSGGFTGGSIDSAVDRLVDAVARYVQQNTKELAAARN